MNESLSNSVFGYFDYREYFEDVYKHLKSTRIGFSYRSFSRDAGIPNHNYLVRVIKRQRNFTLRYASNISRFMNHSKQEGEYFRILVQFNNEKKTKNKELLLRNLLTLRYSIGVHILDDKKLKFLEKWYYPVIRELAVILDFKEDYNLLARKCIPRISPAQAAGAIKYLTENGFLERQSSGKYIPINQAVSTEPEVDSAIIPKYHKTTILQCAEAVETIKKEDRSFSSLTLRVSQQTYEEMKREIESFRRRLLAMATDSKDPEMVCFVGLQLIPRSALIAKADNDEEINNTKQALKDE